VNSRHLTRTAFLAGAFSLGALATAPVAFAARNAEAERYVEANAREALRTLGDRSVSGSERQQTFHALMAQFADMPRLAVWVLGRYGTQLRADPTLRAQWTEAFQDYAIAVYESSLARYSGGTIQVTNSIENVPGRDIVVVSQLSPSGQPRPLPVQWRLLRSADGWKVMDVSLILNGDNQIWLAQQQQRDFLAALDRNGGDVRALMSQVRSQTASMRSRVMAGT
jgi:phospholipid transport system substrate-binding protein